MKYPTCTITKDGVSLTVDIYDLAKALGIESHPLFNALKKLIRRGNGAKSERQDLEEVKQSVDRYLWDLGDEPFILAEPLNATPGGITMAKRSAALCPYCIPGVDNCTHDVTMH